MFGDGEDPLSWGLTLGRVWGVRLRVHLVFNTFDPGGVLAGLQTPPSEAGVYGSSTWNR